MKTDLELLMSSISAMIFQCRQYDKTNTVLPSLIKHQNTIQLMIDDKSDQMQLMSTYKVADRKMTVYIKDNLITLQNADYVEDGYFIHIDKDKIELFEIPLYGGTPIPIGKYNTIIEAIAKSETLT